MRTWTIPLILAGALALLAAAPCGAVTTEFPISSTGDIWFTADHAGFLSSEGGVVEEFYFRVTNDQVEFKEEDGVQEARLFFTLEFRDEEDNKLGEASQEFGFSVPDAEQATSTDYAQLLVLREQIDPRTASVKIIAEDLNARKRGLLYLVTGKRKSGDASGFLSRPEFDEHDFAISDMQFAWTIDAAEEGDNFVKHGMNVVPNPARSYGLLQERLSAYFEVYDRREGLEGERTYVLHHELVAPNERVTRSRADTVQAEGGIWVKVVRFGLEGYETGEYLFRTIVEHPETGARAVTERSFSLLWKNEFWEMSEQELLDEARVLLTEAEYDRFEQMSAGDRALYVQRFWMQYDQALRQEFLRRVDFANRQYADHRRGMLTDRGRMYIRFGPADEITQELVPTGASPLDNQIADITGEDGAIGELLATNDGFDGRPYEIWEYTRQGYPLFPERERTTSVTGLRLVFVDETGTGYYVLRYTSDFLAY